MGKLIRMDLYRVLKSKSFLVCLILGFVIALAEAPFGKLMFTLAKSLSPDFKDSFIAEVNLSAILRTPFPLINLMIVLLSLCMFFSADVENGYIKTQKSSNMYSRHSATDDFPLKSAGKR